MPPGDQQAKRGPPPQTSAGILLWRVLGRQWAEQPRGNGCNSWLVQVRPPLHCMSTAAAPSGGPQRRPPAAAVSHLCRPLHCRCIGQSRACAGSAMEGPLPACRVSSRRKGYLLSQLMPHQAHAGQPWQRKNPKSAAPNPKKWCLPHEDTAQRIARSREGFGVWAALAPILCRHAPAAALGLRLLAQHRQQGGKVVLVCAKSGRQCEGRLS